MTDQVRYPHWLLGLSATQAVTALVFLSFAGAIPLLQAEWQLNHTSVGAIQASGQVGYLLAVVVSSSLADYVSPKKLIVGGALWASLSNLAFAVFAFDTVSAIILRACVGLGVAGIYMPGVKFISLNTPSSQRGRAIGMFVAAFTMGAAVSIALSGNLATLLGWRLAFGLTSIGPLIGAILTLITLPPSAITDQVPRKSLKFSDILNNRAALLIILIYTAHAWELLGLRSWLAAFLTEVRISEGVTLVQATRAGATVAGIATLVSSFATASIGAASDRYKRSKIISIVMGTGMFFTLLLGFTFSLPWSVVIGVSLAATFFTTADSAVISSALTESTPPDILGRILAVYSFLGFTAGSVSPIIFGATLDFANLSTSQLAPDINSTWIWAFATLALGSLIGLVATVVLNKTSST